MSDPPLRVGVHLGAGPHAHLERATTVVDSCRMLEELGVDSIWMGEHAVLPRAGTSSYPGTTDGSMPFSPDESFPDPLAWLAFAAAHTTTLQLGTQVLVLPHHNPVLVAKHAATVDQLSGGRLLLGVGLGWCREEAAAVGYSFSERGARTDEAIVALRRLWSGEDRLDGRWWRFADVVSSPTPFRPPGVPIVVGGSSVAAARRAGRLGDGYFPYVGEPQLGGLLAAMRRAASDAGRDGASIEVTCPVTPDVDVRTVRALVRLGVGRVVVSVRDTRPDVVEAVTRPLVGLVRDF